MPKFRPGVNDPQSVDRTKGCRGGSSQAQTRECLVQPAARNVKMQFQLVSRYAQHRGDTFPRPQQIKRSVSRSPKSLLRISEQNYTHGCAVRVFVRIRLLEYLRFVINKILDAPSRAVKMGILAYRNNRARLAALSPLRSPLRSPPHSPLRRRRGRRGRRR